MKCADQMKRIDAKRSSKRWATGVAMAMAITLFSPLVKAQTWGWVPGTVYTTDAINIFGNFVGVDVFNATGNTMPESKFILRNAAGLITGITTVPPVPPNNIGSAQLPASASLAELDVFVPGGFIPGLLPTFKVQNKSSPTLPGIVVSEFVPAQTEAFVASTLVTDSIDTLTLGTRYIQFDLNSRVFERLLGAHQVLSNPAVVLHNTGPTPETFTAFAISRTGNVASQVTETVLPNVSFESFLPGLVSGEDYAFGVRGDHLSASLTDIKGSSSGGTEAVIHTDAEFNRDPFGL